MRGTQQDIGRGDAGGEQPLPVETSAATRGLVEDLLGFDGKLAAVHRVDITTEVSGMVKRILVEEGDRVRKGQLLAELANPDLRIAGEQARIATRKAELALQDLRAQEAIQGKLVEQGFSSREEAEGLERQRRMAELALQEARAGQRKVELEVSRLMLRSPFDGVVAHRLLDTPGQRCAPAMRAFTVLDPGELVLRQRIPEVSARRLRAGQPGFISPVARPDLRVPASVLRMSPIIDPLTGFQEVTIALAVGNGGLRSGSPPAQARAARPRDGGEPPPPPGQEEHELKPGMFVRVSVLLGRREDAILVDKRSLSYEGEQPRLFVVQDGRARLVYPRLGIGTDQKVEVIEGVAEGDLVVVLGQSKLKDGALVKVVRRP